MEKRLLLPLIGLLAFSLTACGTKGDTGAQGPQGEQGVPGQNGQDGKDGTNGVDGKDGTSVLTGNGEPAASLGKDGDSYIDLDNWNYYVKENGSWALKGNIKGQDGTNGQNGQDGTNGNNGQDGADGVDGQDGTSMLSGSGEPASNLGKDGDSYIDIATWDYYVKENGTWVLKGNIKGQDGTNGNNGQDAVQYIPAIFNNYDGSMLYTFYYEKGSTIVYDGPEPTREGYVQNNEHYIYEFTGWDKSLENIQVPTIFTAQYEVVNVTDIVQGRVPHFSEDGKTLTYGLYPQTVVDDTDLLTKLDALTTPEANGYYLYVGDYYTKVGATPNSTYTFDNGATIVDGTTYWFKCEPITWKVLSNNNDEYYILSSVLLDVHRYDDDSNNYANSEIRSFLNDDFYNSAFALGNTHIQTTTVDNSAATTDLSSNTYACDNTQDKVFLPSYQDYINSSYGFSTSTGLSDIRCCKTTDYARARGVYYNTSSSSYLYNGLYWTRSPYSDHSKNAWNIGDGGSLSYNPAYYTTIGVRPGLSIKIA